MEPRFEQFIRERQYLTNVTPATIEWYRRCLKWLPSECPTQTDLRATVMHCLPARLPYLPHIGLQDNSSWVPLSGDYSALNRWMTGAKRVSIAVATLHSCREVQAPNAH